MLPARMRVSICRRYVQSSGRLCGGQLRGDAEPPAGPRGEGQGAIVCLGDALGDREAESDARVVGADAFVTAKERLGERGDQLWAELLAGVLDSELDDVRAGSGRHPDVAVVRQVVDDRVVQEVRAKLEQESL